MAIFARLPAGLFQSARRLFRKCLLVPMGGCNVQRAPLTQEACRQRGPRSAGRTCSATSESSPAHSTVLRPLVRRLPPQPQAQAPPKANRGGSPWPLGSLVHGLGVLLVAALPVSPKCWTQCRHKPSQPAASCSNKLQQPRAGNPRRRSPPRPKPSAAGL